MKLVIATGNAHKLKEIEELLADIPRLQLLSLSDFPAVEMPEETGATMRENATIKAAHLARASGLLSLADDSGIEVDVLQGAPGVRSARWIEGSDVDRTQALLDALRDTPRDARSARYRCAICLALPLLNNELAIQNVEATCEGRIAFGFHGSNGFGYDPIFEITSATLAPVQYLGKTMAEVPPEVKAKISHRARAIAAMRRHLPRMS